MLYEGVKLVTGAMAGFSMLGAAQEEVPEIYSLYLQKDG